MSPQSSPHTAPVSIQARRSPACGLQCRQRPCNGYELHEAALLARADSQVWLRLWVQALVLAFLTGRPLPHVPQPLRRSWPALDARTRECLLATVVDVAVSSRARALRHSYDPKRLTAVVASVAAGRLASATHQAATHQPAGAAHQAPVTPLRAGHVWVIPQLRWLHEIDRLTRDGLTADSIAPPLDFELAGLLDWPGIRVGDRLDGLRRHRLSMERECNRALATLALLGDGYGYGYGTAEHQTIHDDIAAVGIGRDQQQRVAYAARMLGTTQRGQQPQQPQERGWLEVVLSWPTRFLEPARLATHRAATG
jgi:uncharacterized protein